MSQFRLVRISLIAAALGLTATPPLLTSAHAQAKPAANAKAETLRPDMFKLLDPAKIKELIAAKNYDAIRANLTAARAMPSVTPFEMYVINRTELQLGVSANDEKVISAALEAVLASGRLEAAERPTFVEALGNSYFNASDYPKAIEWFRKYQKESPTPGKVTNVLVRSLYLSNDMPGAKAEMERYIAELEKAGKTPTMEDYKLQGSIALKMKDTAGLAAISEKVVTSYRSPEHWAELTRRLYNKSSLNERLRIDLLRLQMATGAPLDDIDYLEMAERAKASGFYGEAKQTLDAGYAAGKLGTGANAGKHKAALDAATKAANDDAKNIAAGEATAAKAKTGTPLFNLGYAYLTLDQAEKGITLMEQGMAKGGFKVADDNKLRMAAAYAKVGRKDDALKLFREVNGKDGAADIARYWIMLLNTPATTATAQAGAPAAPAAPAAKK